MPRQDRKDKKAKKEDYLGALFESQTKAEDKRVVVSVDFGSTHCGVAYALAQNNDEKPEVFAKIYRKKYTKQPTCALFDKTSKQLVSFGFDARDEYMAMESRPKQRSKYLYFEGQSIKMRLWEASLRVDASCETVDKTGELSLMRVVSAILGHLKEEALAMAAKGTNLKIPVDEALWVLTVPSIWQEADKQFMRRAAHKAHIIKEPASSDLVLALEPECAVIAAKNAIGDFKVNEKIMCMDCGGGTVDICAVEVLHVPSERGSSEKLRLRQLLEPSGGNWGSTFIDQNFLSFLSILFNDARLEYIRKISPGAVIEVLDEWETVKTGVKAKEFAKRLGEKSINLSPILDALKQNNDDHDLAKMVDAYNTLVQEQSPKLELSGILVAGRPGQETNIVIPMRIIVSFFSPVLDKILGELEHLLRTKELHDLDYLLMVGGFAESEVLRVAVKRKLKGRNIDLIVPKHAASVVQKGAVEYGLNPAIISTRRARQTIGVKVTMRLDDVPDPDNETHNKHRFYDKISKETYVRDIFNAYIIKGQEVESSMVVRRQFSSQNKKSKRVKFDIYATDSQTPLHVTEPGCVRLAKIVVDVEPDSNPRLECMMHFASTEITAEIKNLDNGKVQQLLLEYDNMGFHGSISTFVRVPVRDVQPWGGIDFDEYMGNVSEMI